MAPPQIGQIEKENKILVAHHSIKGAWSWNENSEMLKQLNQTKGFVSTLDVNSQNDIVMCSDLGKTLSIIMGDGTQKTMDLFAANIISSVLM